MAEECCKCKWWRKFAHQDRGSDIDSGRCHRFPPVLCEQQVISEVEFAAEIDEPVDSPYGIANVSFNFWFPATDADDFCGEFSPCNNA